MKVFLDLDGVLTDLESGMAKLLDEPLKRGKTLGREAWIAAARAGEKFWSGLDWMPDSKRLWDELKKHHPTVLSRPSNHPSSKPGKKLWVKNNLGPDVPIILQKHKEEYAGPDAILIDDRVKNIELWRDAGGIGILHKGVDSTLKKVKEAISMSKEAFKLVPVKDPLDPERNILLAKMRGGKPTKVHESEKKYKRREEKDWRRHVQASTLRVILAYLDSDATFAKAMVEEAKKSQIDVDKIRTTYESIKRIDPTLADTLNRESKIEAILIDAPSSIGKIRQGDWQEMGRFDDRLSKLKFILKKYPGIKALIDKTAYETGMKFKTHPVIITPYDAIVQKAYDRMGPEKKNIDVIKLEPTCHQGHPAWVTNQDLLYGKEGEQRVVHICLNSVKDEVKKLFGSFNVNDPEHKKRMEEILLERLRGSILLHEEKHIEQEIQRHGEFGPGAEQEAERAEDWSQLEQMGLRKKMASRVVLRYLHGQA